MEGQTEAESLVPCEIRAQGQWWGMQEAHELASLWTFSLSYKIQQERNF